MRRAPAPFVFKFAGPGGPRGRPIGLGSGGGVYAAPVLRALPTGDARVTRTGPYPHAAQALPRHVITIHLNLYIVNFFSVTTRNKWGYFVYFI